MNEEETPRSGMSKRKQGFIAAAMILVAILVPTFFINSTQPEIPTGGWFYDQSAQAIQEAVDHEVADGYFNMTINTDIPVYEQTHALAGIQNIASNKYDCVVSITLDDGTDVFQSGGLSPGQELQSISLNQPLDKGEHEAIALFEIYDPGDSHAKVGETASHIQLISQ